jgi:hypothetical protein
MCVRANLQRLNQRLLIVTFSIQWQLHLLRTFGFFSAAHPRTEIDILELPQAAI